MAAKRWELFCNGSIELALLCKSQIPLRYLVRSWSPTSFEPDTVIELRFNGTDRHEIRTKNVNRCPLFNLDRRI